jgi:hypothetical protein
VNRLRRIPGAVAAAIARVVDPLRPEPGTTEASVYFGLVLIAGGFLAAGDVPKALGIPGVVITILGSAPAIVGIRRAA